MSATLAWTALAVAVLSVAAPSPAPARAAGLVHGRRLAGPSRPVGRRFTGRWPGLGRHLPALGAGLVLLLGLWAGVAAAIAAGSVGGCGWLLARDLAARRRSRTRGADLARAVQVLAGELEAGAQPVEALRAAGAAAPAYAEPFGRAAAAAGRGEDAAKALLDEPDTAALGVAWLVGHDGGTALAAVVRRVGLDLRVRAEQRSEVEVALAGPRASAALLSGLPVLGIGLGTAMGARPVAFLVESPAGRALACAGLLFDVAGVLWVRRILRTASPA